MVGSWQNERPFNSTMVVMMRKELDRRGYGHVKLAVGEMRGGQAPQFGDVPNQFAAKPALADAAAMLALHYGAT